MKKSKVFRLSSLLSLVLMLVFLAVTVANHLGMTIDYETQYEESEYEIKYENFLKTEGAYPDPIKACFVLDSSNSGWQAVVRHDMLSYIVDVLHRFEGQGHTVEFDGYSSTDGSRSTGAFLPIESGEDANLWRAISKFEESYKEPWGDLPYKLLIENGIDALSATDDCDNKVLILIIGSPDTRKMTSEDIESIKNTLEEKGVSLYVIGLPQKGNDYELLSKLTDNVYKEIKISEIEEILTDIFEGIAYREIENTPQYVEIAKPVDGRQLRNVSFRLYSTEEFSCTIDKLTTLDDGRASETNVVEKGNCKTSTEIIIPDFVIEEQSSTLKYVLNYSDVVEDQNIYVAVDYETAEVILPPNKIVKLGVFDWVQATYNIPAEIITYIALGLSALMFLIPIIIRLSIKNEYKKKSTGEEIRR